MEKLGYKFNFQSNFVRKLNLFAFKKRVKSATVKLNFPYKTLTFVCRYPATMTSSKRNVPKSPQQWSSKTTRIRRRRRHTRRRNLKNTLPTYRTTFNCNRSTPPSIRSIFKLCRIYRRPPPSPPPTTTTIPIVIIIIITIIIICPLSNRCRIV